LQYGWLLLLNVLDLQHDYFKLDELKELLDRCFEAYRTAWFTEEPSTSPNKVDTQI